MNDDEPTEPMLRASAYLDGELDAEEMASAEDLGNYFRVPPDRRDLNYGKYFEQGEAAISRTQDYHSHNTTRLDLEGMKTLLLKLDTVHQARKGERPSLADVS